MRYDEESDTHWVEHKKKNASDIENDFYFRYPSKCIIIFFFFIFFSFNYCPFKSNLSFYIPYYNFVMSV